MKKTKQKWYIAIGIVLTLVVLLFIYSLSKDTTNDIESEIYTTIAQIMSPESKATYYNDVYTSIQVNTRGSQYGDYSQISERTCLLNMKFSQDEFNISDLYGFPSFLSYYNKDNVRDIPIYYDKTGVLDIDFGYNEYVSLYSDFSEILLVSSEWPWQDQITYKIVHMDDYMEVATDWHTFIYELSQYKKYQEACIVVIDEDTFVVSNIYENIFFEGIPGEVVGSAFVFKKHNDKYKLYCQYHLIYHGFPDPLLYEDGILTKD